jgi:hypothetical protein
MNLESAKYSMKHNNILVMFAIIFYLSIGPIFNNLPIKLVLIIGLLFVYILNYRLIKFTKKHIFFYFLIVVHIITTSLACYVNKTVIPLIFGITFDVAFFSAIQMSKSELLRFVNLLTKILKYTVILSWIGFIYSLFAPPLFSLINPNGTQNFFWLTTFSITESPIRASGFYDEPGAFSFFICLLVFFRTYLGLDLKTNLILMIGGFVTQSTAHAIFFIVWLMTVLFTDEAKVKLSLLYRFLILAFVVLIAFFAVLSGTFQWAIERGTKWYEDPDSAERVRYFNNAYEKIDESQHNLIYGFGYDCVNRDDCEGYTENLLTPIAMGGLMSSWPFYLFLIFCLLYPLLSLSNFSLIGIGLLILQRPYFLELPYSFCLVIVITLFIEINPKEERQNVMVNS